MVGVGILQKNYLFNHCLYLYIYIFCIFLPLCFLLLVLPRLVVCLGCLVFSPALSPSTPETHTESSMFALPYTTKASVDHLTPFLITASGTSFGASLLAPYILPECNAQSSGSSLALAPVLSSFHLPPTSAMALLKHWVACSPDHTLRPFAALYGTRGASPVSSSLTSMLKISTNRSLPPRLLPLPPPSLSSVQPPHSSLGPVLTPSTLSASRLLLSRICSLSLKNATSLFRKKKVKVPLLPREQFRRPQHKELRQR